MNTLVGTTIHHYQVLVKIRETPTRVLYKAYDTRAYNYKALEVVKFGRINLPELLNLINEQVRKTAQVEHPNIAEVMDTGIQDGVLYIVYNFCPTYPLRRFFNRTYAWQEMSRELVAITQALARAHEKGLQHGSLNPSSIILDDKKKPMLFDFGLEQIITNYLLTQSPGTWVNRWGYEYRAPEQLRGASVDWRSDIYSFGMIMHEWLNGKTALVAGTVLDTLQMRTNPPTAPEAKKEQKPALAAIQTLIKKCIAVNPADRYQSMQEVSIILARGALDMTITNQMVEKPLLITESRFRVSRSFMTLGILGVLAFLWFAFTNRSTLWPASATEASATVAATTPAKTKAATTPTVRAVFTPTPSQTILLTPIEPINTVVFPVFQETSLSSLINQPITTQNISQMIMIGLWGIGDVNHLTTSPDGKHLGVASSIGIFVFDAQTLKFEKYLDTRSWISTLEFSPDGKIIASGDRDGLIQTWSMDTWEESIPYSGHTKAILDLAFSPDGSKLAAVGLDETLIQWQTNSANPTPMRVSVTGVTSVAYSTDSSKIITGGNDFKINIWDANNLSLIHTTNFSAKIVDLAGVKGSSLFVIGGTDQKVGLLDIASGESWKPLGNLQYPLTTVSASPTRELFAAGDINGGITVWDKNGTQLWKTQNLVTGGLTINDSGSLHTVAFSPDGNYLFSGLQNGVLRSLDAKTGQVAQQNQALNAHIQKLVISHNSQYAITQQDGNILTIWDIWNGRPLYQRQGVIKTNEPFSQNDKFFAVASDASTVKVYALADGQEFYTFRGHQNLGTIQFVNGDTQLAAGYDQLMHLWSMSSGQELKVKKNYEGQGCSSVYDFNDQPLLSITNFQYVLLNNQNNSGLCSFQKLNWVISINEASHLIAYGGNSKLTIVNTQSGESHEMAGVNRKNIVSVAISPNGDLLAAAFDDHTLHIWDVNTYQEIMNLYGHSNMITDLKFTPNGRLLISTSTDGTIRLWGVP
jgi:WD40 repeat protein